MEEIEIAPKEVELDQEQIAVLQKGMDEIMNTYTLPPSDDEDE